MPPRKPLDPGRELLDALDHAFAVTEYLVNVVPDEVWDAPPAGGTGRSIAGIAAHVQSLRRTFANMAKGGEPLPALPRTGANRAEVLVALAGSREKLLALFGGAIERGEGRVPGMPRRTIPMMTYLMQHDAHHRGQIIRQMRELGHRLDATDNMVVWGWRKLP